MAKVRGTGMAAVNYPTGMNLGGDPSQALIHSTTTGTFVISPVQHRSGPGTEDRLSPRSAAETLGLPFENVLIDTADTDTGPHCMGTFASRATHRVGNAVIMAAKEARKAMLEVAAAGTGSQPRRSGNGRPGQYPGQRLAQTGASTSSTWPWRRTSSMAKRSPGAASS